MVLHKAEWAVIMGYSAIVDHKGQLLHVISSKPILSARMSSCCISHLFNLIG